LYEINIGEMTKLKFIFSYSLLLFSQLLFGQCNTNNTFLGTVNGDWHNANNWSSNCVPTLPNAAVITIAANCNLVDTMTYHFSSDNTLIINPGVRFNVSYGVSNPFVCGQPLIYGGQSYNTVLVGSQCWMAQNLNIGSMIPSSVNQTNNAVIEKYCMDDSPAECAIYGGLYQWNELMKYSTIEGAQGICPDGWHLPSENDWTTLESALPVMDVGSRLSGNGLVWEDGMMDQSSVFGTSGFNVLPGGLSEDGSTYSQGFNAFFWASTAFGANAAAFNIYFDIPDLLPATSIKSNGYSIRCLKN
jgi:uncharacterized protein (TIGR02145 family)